MMNLRKRTLNGSTSCSSAIKPVIREKFYNKENQAAGTRVRKGMQDLKVLAQEIRLQVQNMKNDEK
jgi:hypothetical protein